MIEAIERLRSVCDRIAALVVPSVAITPVSRRRDTVQSGNYRISNIRGNPIFWQFRESDYEGWTCRDEYYDRVYPQPKTAWIAVPTERLSDQQWEIAKALIKETFKGQPEKALVVGIRLLGLTVPKKSDEIVDHRLSLNLDYLYLNPNLSRNQWQKLINWARFLGLDSRVKVWNWEEDRNKKVQIVLLKKAE